MDTCPHCHRLLKPKEPLAFTGSYLYILDAKGRLVIPAEFRRISGESFWLVAREHSVSLFPARAEAEFRAAKSQIFLVVCCPSTGRITFPVYARERLGLKRYDEMLISGCGDYVKIEKNS